jgi:hypothetical protein
MLKRCPRDLRVDRSGAAVRGMVDVGDADVRDGNSRRRLVDTPSHDDGHTMDGCFRPPEFALFRDFGSSAASPRT